jgi:hypothetical protein
VLVTTLADSAVAYRLYAQRMRVEQLFRDAKSHFELRKSRLTTTDRPSRLLVVLMLALWWLALLVRRIPHECEALVRGRGPVSFVNLALEWIRRPRSCPLLLAPGRRRQSGQLSGGLAGDR